MEIKTFKIRLMYYEDSTKSEKFIDELLDDTGLTGSCCEYSWIEVGSGDIKGSKSYIKQQNHNRVRCGFNDDDVIMDVEYKDKMIQVTLIASDSFNKLVTVIDNFNNAIITRTLFDWVKLCINGQISDGIGEDSVAIYRDPKTFKEYEVWLSSFITDEPIGHYGFEVGAPIKFEKSKELVDSFSLPYFKTKLDELTNIYKKYSNENNFGPDRKKIQNEIEELYYINLQNITDKLNELDKNNYGNNCK